LSEDLVKRLSLWVTAKGKGQGNQLNKFMLPQPESMNKSWAHSFSFLEKLQEGIYEDGFNLTVIPIPLKEEIDLLE
jgi:hypothetical protein